MIENFEKFKRDMRKASVLGKDIQVKDYDKIIFCGIGGSAAPGEIIRDLNLKIPVVRVKEVLPEWADRKTLCFIVSYSGNTNETINLYKKAKKRNCKIVIITSGGKLGNLNEKKIIIPEGYEPREALIYLLFPILNILKINYKDCFNIKISENEIKKVAEKFRNKRPVIYSSSENLKCIAFRWQTFFNENSKVLAHSNYFPEVAHNEIEARNSKLVVLLSNKETKQIKRSKKFLNFIEIKLKGNSLLSKIIYGIYFGYMVSYYLSKILKVDYMKIKRIDYLKK